VRAGLRAVLLALLATAAAAAPKESKIDAAARTLGQAAQQRGVSDADARQAVAVLRELAESGVPVSHALQVVTAALSGNSGAEMAAIARGARDAFARGASSHELVNLTEDLARSGVDARGVVNALEAVGRLAEEGYTDAETRRGVATTALQSLHEGHRGRELSEAIREETRDAKDEQGEPAQSHGASASAHGRDGAADDSKDKSEIRDDLRRNPPPGAPSNRGPGHNRGNSDRPDKPDNPGGGNDKPDNPNKPDNPGGGNGKK